jgi:hypothetical protein
MAIALERFLVPGVTADAQTAYSEALLRVCTSLTKGWFRQFAVDHWPQVSFARYRQSCFVCFLPRGVGVRS